MKRSVAQLLLFFLLFLALVPLASAQATRTWVSGVGDDANPCSRTAPCKTFAGAISKTAAGGEIDALDPGGFGSWTITKAITIDGGGGQVASVLASGANGIVISAGVGDTIILRNLRFNGISGTGQGGLNGIRFLAGKQLVVENCDIFGFTQNGIDVALNQSASASVAIRNTTLSNNAGDGIKITNAVSGTPVFGSLAHVAVRGGTNSVESSIAAVIDINHSEFSSFSGSGLLISGSGFNSGTISAESNMITGGGTAVSPQAAGVIRLSNNDLFSNAVATGSGTGTIVSAGNNRQAGNGTGFQLRAASITTF